MLKTKSTNFMSCWQLPALIERRAGNRLCWYKFQVESKLKIGLIHAIPLFTGSCLAGQPVTDTTMCFKKRPIIICSSCNLGLNHAFEWDPAHKGTISIIKSKWLFNRQSIYLLNYKFGGFGGGVVCGHYHSKMLLEWLKIIINEIFSYAKYSVTFWSTN